jgi:hypothetical protein
MHKFSQKLTHANIPHRFVSETDDKRHWPYSTSQERIQYLADARNKAMEPLQSEDDSVRLPDYNEFTRVVFINDVIYKWESVVRLIATRMDEDESKAGEYDLACGLDFAISGKRLLALLESLTDIQGCTTLGSHGTCAVHHSGSFGHTQRTSPLSTASSRRSRSKSLPAGMVLSSFPPDPIYTRSQRRRRCGSRSGAGR